ncbi:hypothetical protein FRC06_010463 [Ceratobasidium sp. 370]|nr:hypothetical protein FRC06_010463 [Ceratobasidium sp. 370]
MELTEKANERGTHRNDKPEGSDIPLRETRFGVWTVFTLPPPPLTSTLPGMRMMSQLYESWQNLPIIWRFFSDTITLGPWLFVLHLGSAALSSIFSVLQLYNETALLRMVQDAIANNKPVTYEQFRLAKYYTMVTNNSWLSMTTLFELGTDPKYKKEVLGNNLDKHIISEYEGHRKELGDIWVSPPDDQMIKKEPFTYMDIDSLFDSLPLLVYAYRSMMATGNVDLSNLMLMQQASNTVQHLIYRTGEASRALSGAMKSINALYEVIDAKPAMIDGDLAYPEEQFIGRKGMSLEFRSVCFSYPQKSELALKNLTFTIHPGQLCVIVGENGCGKSTTVQLFARLYDVTSGDILVDGRPLHEFRVRDVRSAVSLMYQDYKHLPLTVHENILLGRPDAAEPREEVQNATRLGGAYDIVQKLPLKYDTNLEPRNTGYSRAGWKSSHNKAFERFDKAQEPTKLSGGEWQRLALSRSFMRSTNQVRLLCYDEPSASLDPKAEQETFERLRKLRGEKTMVFVTHRFGHLTKYADLILYMKEGSIIEQGTHNELLEQAGEYAKMYNIQAQAFSE